MPQYTMKNKKTGEKQHLVLSLQEREQWLEAHPEWIQVPSAPRIVSGVGGVLSKTDDGWKDVLKRVKSGAAKSNTIRD